MRIQFFFLLFLAITLPILSGFPVGTSVKIPTGHAAIEELILGSIICCEGGNQSRAVGKKVNSRPGLRILLDDQEIIACESQLWFVPNLNTWVYTKDLKQGDALCNDHGELISIRDIIPCGDQPIEHVDISLGEWHTFYVTNKHILVHNCVPAVFGLAESAPVAITAAKIGFAGLVTWFAKQVQKGNGRRTLGGSAAPQPRQPPEPEDESPEEWKREHPNGKYRDVLYHHPNSRGPKSKSPKNGQQALDNSFLIKEKGNARFQQRIGVSEGEIVMLNQECVEGGNRVFHGHVEAWNNLKEPIQNILINNKIVSSAGKIL